MNDQPMIFDDKSRSEAAARVLAEANRLENEEGKRSEVSENFDEWQLKAREVVSSWKSYG